METRLFDVVVLGGPKPWVRHVAEAEISGAWTLAVDFGSRSGRFSVGEVSGNVVFCADAPLMCARLSAGAFEVQGVIAEGIAVELDREGTVLYSDSDGDAVVLFCAHARTRAVVDSLESAAQLSDAQKRASRAAAARLGLSDRSFVELTKTRRPSVKRKRDPFALAPEEVVSALEVRMLSAHEYLVSKVMVPAIDQVEKQVISAGFSCDIEVTVSGDHVLLSASQALDYVQLE